MERTKSTKVTPVAPKSVTEVKVTKPEEKELAKPKPQTVTEPEEVIRPLLKWRLTSGSLRIFGKKIPVNGVFEAYPEQIPAVFKRSVVCLSDEFSQKLSAEMAPDVPKKETLYAIRPATAKGWYNVVNVVTQKPLNEKTLKLADAEKLLGTLNV